MSRPYHVLAVDVGGIQSYIFGSNTLRENVGASYLVAAITEKWAFEELTKSLQDKKLNLVNGHIHPELHIEENDLAAEVLYAGGGKFLALFRDSTDVKEFGRTLSKRVLEQAPGLTLSIGHSLCNLDQESLSQAVSEAIGDAAIRRKVAPQSAPLLGLGVTVACTSTGMPAVAMSDSLKDDEGNSDAPRPISAEVRAKWDVVKPPHPSQPSLAQQALLDAIEGVMLGDFEFPLDFDNLGRSKGDTSYIGVVHADGNGIGKKFGDLSHDFEEKIGVEQNRAYITAVRDLSDKVKYASKKALQALVKSLVAKIKERKNKDGKTEYFISVGEGQSDIVLLKRGNKYQLPFRPLIFGGDDLTFVCDGRLAVGLAAAYLGFFEAATRDILGKTYHAAAGITIVKTHYPFSRAYDLAEELCSSAKKAFHGQSISQLDWYIAQSGTYDKLEDMREREYRSVNDEKLTVRPFTLSHTDTGKANIHDWATITHLLKEFSSREWAEKRNKALALQEALREGKDAVDRFTTLFGVTLPTLNGLTYEDPIGRGAYFDALELLDFYIQI